MHRIDEPHETELPACRHLLPACFTATAAPELLVARRDGGLAGAAAISWVNTGRPGAFNFSLFVDPAWRRRGIGRALAEAAARLCRAETAFLRTHPALSVADPSESFLAATGFMPEPMSLHFEVDVRAVHGAVAGLARRAAHRCDDDTLRLVGLHEAPAAAVAAMWLAAFPGARDGNPLPAVLGRGPGALSADVSFVALTGTITQPRVVGLALCRHQHGEGAFELLAVTPDWEGRGLTLRLLEAATRAKLASGELRVRLFCSEATTEVQTLMRRAGGALVRQTRTWQRPTFSATASSVVAAA